ncbi:hypothetical protein KPL40_07180 [Clostridium gasigenes]|uniref:hypothetical protein n=1 Tax=Clostridium gasigenes TaxID=94869 RepID=UPI001C0BFAB2|nr:hypothetical protein [Clostridium gasigenes]MBU3132234.1 hypothetical protein [Clostridium gasigenes]
MEEEYVAIINTFKFENDEFNSIHVSDEDGKLIDIIDIEFTYKEEMFKTLCNEWIKENE